MMLSTLPKGEEVKCASDILIYPELREEFGKWNNLLAQNVSGKCISGK